MNIVLSNKWNGSEMNSMQDYKLSVGQLGACSLKFDTSEPNVPFVGQDQFTSKLKLILHPRGFLIRNSASEVSPGGDQPAI